MSILYLKIDKTDENNQITDWSIIQKFKDETELAKWFAYDYNEKKEIYDYYSCSSRFISLLKNQRLCKDDSYGECGGYIEEGMYINGIMTSYVQEFRNRVLYDDVYNRFLDIRNYRQLIKHHLNDSIRDTEWDKIYADKRWHRYHIQGRSHGKSGHYKHIAMGKGMILLSDRHFVKYERKYVYEDDEYKVSCSVPKTRGKRYLRKLGWWDDYYAHTENNWKEKKCRHQWQVHKPYTNFRQEKIRRYKECQVMSDEEVRLMDEEFWEEGYDVRLDEYWRSPSFYDGLFEDC